MDFYKRVAIVCNKIPWGKVATYGQIALLCGKPKNARQVGFGLNCRIKEPVPAHRVVNANGYLSGAAAFSAAGQQETMLRSEGVEVIGQQVDLKKYGWHNTMEEALELKLLFEEEEQKA